MKFFNAALFVLATASSSAAFAPARTFGVRTAVPSLVELEAKKVH